MRDGPTTATSARTANTGNARNVRRRGVISGGTRLVIMVLCMGMQLGLVADVCGMAEREKA